MDSQLRVPHPIGPHRCRGPVAVSEQRPANLKLADAVSRAQHATPFRAGRPGKRRLRADCLCRHPIRGRFRGAVAQRALCAPRFLSVYDAQQRGAPPNVHRQTLPRWVNRLLWRAAEPLADLALRGSINRGRATLGLAALDNPISQIPKGRTILAADRDLGPLPDDAPKYAMSTDAFVLDEPGTLDGRVEALLQQGPAPIYIGFGSMIAPRAPKLVAQAVAAVRAVGRRAVIAGGWAALEAHIQEADDLIAIDNVPHSLIFPRVAAAVHHGGAGTTTAMARAGVPQVLLPHILDQYYWAHRVEVLGLGPPALPIERVTTDALCERISRAVSDPLILQRVN